VLLKGRWSSMPKENIERAIQRGIGGGEVATYEDLTYEIFGPHGVAIMAEISTDNRNRTAAEIRSIVTKGGGNIATAGAVTRLFQRKGHLIIPREATDEDTVMEIALEAGAEDFKAEPEGYDIITDPATFEAVHQALEAKGITCASAQVSSLPLLTVKLDDPEAAAAVAKVIEQLEDHDDVKELFSNADFGTTEA